MAGAVSALAASVARNEVTLSWAPPVDGVNFESGALPTGLTSLPSGDATIVDDADAVGGTTKALQPADLGDSTTAGFSLPLNGLGPFEIRYRLSSESNYDFGRIYMDDVQIYSSSGTVSWSTLVTPSYETTEHVLKVEYQKDSSQSSGFDNIRIGSVLIPFTGTYEYRIDGGPAVPVSGTSVRITGLAAVPTHFEVRAEDGGPWSSVYATPTNPPIGMLSESEFAMHVRSPQGAPWAPAEVDQQVATWNYPLGSVEGFLGRAVATEVAQPLVVKYAQSSPLGRATETETVYNLPYPQVVEIGQVAEAESVTDLQFLVFQALQITLDAALSLSAESIVVAPEFQVHILDPIIDRGPGALTVVLSGGIPETDVEFAIDGTPVLTVSTDSSGELGVTSITLTSALGAIIGPHDLTASQVNPVGGVAVATATYEVLRNPQAHPITAGPDSQAVEVPGAVVGGVRHWVLQDMLGLAEGGIGSYVLPISPKEMTSPHVEKTLASMRSTAISGQFHVFQAGATAKEWEFSGYCPTQEMHDKLLAYRRLNRRIYIIDHRNRAWKAVITDVDIRPRLRHQYLPTTGHGHNDTDWGSDYTVSATIVDQDWVTPA